MAILGLVKTAFVHKLYEPLAKKRGFFISGKLDQIKRDIPFATITQAIQNLVQYLLTESEDQIEHWRQRLEEEVGSGLAFITRLVPKIELLLGQQARPFEYPPQEMKPRCNEALRRFIKVFARPEHPLVLFLDDLQWADLDTLGLIKKLHAEGADMHLFIIGSYRDNEVSVGKLLELMGNEGDENTPPVQQIVLQPLTIEPLNEIVMETLRCQSADAAPLTDLIFKKTLGNPLFSIQFLQNLYQEQLLRYDQEKNVWNWDLRDIESQNFADSLLSLLLEKLKKLPKPTRNLLQLASCLGNNADIEKLALIACKSEAVVFDNLLPASREGLISVRDGFANFCMTRCSKQRMSCSRLISGKQNMYRSEESCTNLL